MIRAVIFDFGGVIVRTEDQHGRRKWEARLGIPEGALAHTVFGSEAAARATLGRVPESEVWRHVAVTYGLSAEQLKELHSDFWSGDRLDAELVRFIRSLRPRYATALLSNAWPDARDAFTQEFGLADAVDAMIISAEEGVAKPDARIYQIAAQRLGVRPEQAVFVDDVVENVQGAQAAGLQAIHFQNREQALSELRVILDHAA